MNRKSTATPDVSAVRTADDPETRPSRTDQWIINHGERLDTVHDRLEELAARVARLEFIVR